MNSKDKAWLALEAIRVEKVANPIWFEWLSDYIKELERKTEFAVFDDFDPIQRFYRD